MHLHLVIHSDGYIKYLMWLYQNLFIHLLVDLPAIMDSAAMNIFCSLIFFLFNNLKYFVLRRTTFNSVTLLSLMGCLYIDDKLDRI